MMAISIDIRPDTAKLQRFLGDVSKEVENRAQVRAMNRGARKTNTVGIRALAKESGVKQKILRAKVRVALASPRRLISAVKFNPRGFNPIRLGMTPAQAQKFYKGAFVGKAFAATMPNGSRQYAARMPSSRTSEGEDKKGRHKRNRLPINTIRIRIGKAGIRLFDEALKNDGLDALLKEYTRQIALIRAKGRR